MGLGFGLMVFEGSCVWKSIRFLRRFFVIGDCAGENGLESITLYFVSILVSLTIEATFITWGTKRPFWATVYVLIDLVPLKYSTELRRGPFTVLLNVCRRPP